MAHHHHHHHRHSSTTTTIGGAGYYNDVFNGAGATLRHHHRGGRGGVAFVPHPNDYADIFGGFRSRAATSIPLLEIPTARDEVMVEEVDVFDYEEVFGGGREVVIGVPYEWFVREEEEEEEGGEVWSPAGSASAYSEGNQFMQMENHHRKNFNASYHEAVLTSGEGDLNGIHVAKYDSFPGYTHVADGVDKFIPQKLSQDRFVKQPLSHTSHHGSEIQSECKHGKTHGCSRSPMNPTSVFVSDSLRTQPSHVPPPSRPPPLPVERDGFSGNLSAAPMPPKVFAHEIAEDDSSPIFFDAEVDGSLFVSDSAASIDVVIEKAVASLRTAKELMRKNGGSRSHSSSGRDIDSDSGRKGGMNSKGILEDHRCNTSREREQNGRENPRKESQGGSKAVPVLSDLSVHSLNVPQKPSQKKHKRKKSAVVYSSLTEETGKWMEAMKYYEYAKDDNCMFATMLPNSAENVAVLEAPDYSNCCSDGKKASSDVQHSSDEGIEAARRASGHREKVVMPSNSMDVDYDLKEHKQRSKLAKSAIRLDSLEEMVQLAQEISDRVVYDHTEVNESLERDRKGLMDERNLRTEKAVEKNERQPIIACQLPDHDFSYVELCLDKEEFERELWESLQREEENKKAKDGCEMERREKEFKETSDTERRQRKLKVAHRKEEKEDRQNPRAVLENDSRRNKACNKDDNRQVVQESNKRNAEDRSAGCRIKLSDDKDRSEEKLEMAANGNSSKVSPHMDDNMGMTEVSATKGCAVNEASDLAWVESNNRGADGFECFTEVLKEDANLARYGEALAAEESKRGDDDAEHLRLFNKSPEVEAVSEKPIHASEASVTVEDMDNSLLGHDLQFFEVRVGRPDTPAMMGLFLPDFSKLLAGDFNLGKKKSKPDVLGHEHGFLQNNSEAQGAVGQGVSDRTQQVMAESNCDAIKTENVEIAGITTECPGQGDAKDELPEFRVGEVLSSDRLDGLTMKFNDVHIVSNHTIDDRKEAMTPSLTKNIGEAVVGRMNNVVETPVSYDQEVNSSSTEPIRGLTGISGETRFMQAAQAVISETKQNINKSSQPSGTSQHTVRKGNEGNAVDKEEPVKTDKELENEHRRKLEEERERERSKDRKAVDMMKSEARERPNLERQTLESRQKAMAEARERLERACSEARESSLAEKTAAEAKRRAERAAVERANAEAKQRLLEKVTVQARERFERSVSDKLSSSSRSTDTRQGSSLSSIDNCHGGGCESTQRYNARLGSNRRTAERMADALTVKKTRDLVAQREHAERNRLAETLDADIKRWSNGKEGNLRALLSTLQYILGPDSGWQPIPLTDVITAAAAKKAYRKAALYVHPDKVQQRGANVRQKYICEKVFYLLQILELCVTSLHCCLVSTISRSSDLQE
ncbi:Auxilin-like protein [Drosera capensis]